MNLPMGSEATRTVICVMMSGSRLYEKNWFRKESRTQDMRPRTHIRNVHTGRAGSSVTGTVRRTCSMGEISSEVSDGTTSSFVGGLVGVGGGDSSVPMVEDFESWRESN